MSFAIQEGMLLIDKPAGMTSFQVVARCRKLTGVQKIGHGGTLDPFATGVLVVLVGRKFTRMADQFLCDEKEYTATLLLGSATDTHDLEGQVTERSEYVPSLQEIEAAVAAFQGTFQQIPPMFSAKRIGGKRLYELARKGKEIERASVSVTCKITIEEYSYPHLKIHVTCSKGTYIRVLAHDIGIKLGSFAHLIALRRVRSGNFKIGECVALPERVI